MLDVKRRNRESMALMELPKRTQYDEMLKIVERNIRVQKLKEKQITRKPSVISVAIPLPPPTGLSTESKTEMSVSAINGTEMECNNETARKQHANYLQQLACIHHNHDNHHEEEVLSLQVLSARSSTPYTQTMSCTAASCDLENVTEHVSPVKDTDGNISKQNIREARENSKGKKVPLVPSKTVPALTLSNACCRKLSKSKSNVNSSNDSCLRYTRASLLIIRNEMSASAKSKLQNNQISSYGPPNMVNCDVIELEARLKRLGICKHNNNSNMKARCNDMMPAFVKRKFMDESIIRSQPPQPLEFKVRKYIENYSVSTNFDPIIGSLYFEFFLSENQLSLINETADLKTRNVSVHVINSIL